MPILDGFKASMIIRQLHRQKEAPEPLIIACTGHTEDEYILKAWRHEIDQLIPKPIKAEALKLILGESFAFD